MKPHVSILMLTSIDGRLHPSRFTASPDGTRRDWSAQYEKVHASLEANAWLVGRVTMAEMSKTGPHAPSGPWTVQRPIHVARTDASAFAVALDPSGKLHFQSGTLSGDHVIVLLGRDVPDSHLAELAADGVSYIVFTNCQNGTYNVVGKTTHIFQIKMQSLMQEGSNDIFICPIYPGCFNHIDQR